MNVLGLDIGKANFDAHLLAANRTVSIHPPNTQAGFTQLRDWLVRNQEGDLVALHACTEATGNYGLDLAAFLHAEGITVSIVNPKRIKAYGQA